MFGPILRPVAKRPWLILVVQAMVVAHMLYVITNH